MEMNADDLLKTAQAKKEKVMIFVEKERIKSEKEKDNIAKIEVLRCLLLGEIIDEEKASIGSERVYKNLFTEEEMYLIKGKLKQLIEKL